MNTSQPRTDSLKEGENLSPAGARGPLQILESTYNDYAKSTGDKEDFESIDKKRKKDSSPKKIKFMGNIEYYDEKNQQVNRFVKSIDDAIALNDDNKKKYAAMVHKSKDHFMRASEFAFRHVK